jgi:hypothetical protein
MTADQRRRLRNRKYGRKSHHGLRARLQSVVAAGLANCARCGEVIDPGEPWDLGHDDRTGLHSGPEHASCNRSAPHKNKTSRQW